ncbi:MAG: carbohydrate binding domain-containing protein [Candidatus Daviesbacteria bacterium]|nr:carbohydrate binding domain-containing protein [Candidatus Daviesbacteria bacterium]
MARAKQSTISVLRHFSFAQNSNVKLAVLTSVLSLVLFFTVASLSPFKNMLLSSLFPKQASYASITSTPAPTTGLNLLKNGSFEEGVAPWFLNVTPPAAGSLLSATNTAIDGRSSATVNINSNASQSWYVQFRQDNLSLLAGKSYTLTFWAKADKRLKIDYALQQMESPYTVYFGKSINLSTKWQKYSYFYNATANLSNVFLGFNLASTKASIWIDNVSLVSN